MRKIKNLLLGTIALLIMLMGMSVCAFADDAPTLIKSSIMIDNFNSPKIGNPYPEANAKNYFSLTSNYFTIKDVRFYKISDGTDIILETAGAFKAGGEYKISFTIEAKNGYYFSASQQKAYATIDGSQKELSVSAAGSKEYGSSSYVNTLKCTYTFDKLSSSYINYGIKIGDAFVTSDNKNDVLGILDKDKATVTYDNTVEDTLVLNGATIEGAIVVGTKCNFVDQYNDTIISDRSNSGKFSIKVTGELNGIITDGFSAINTSGLNLELYGDGKLVVNHQSKSNWTLYIFSNVGTVTFRDNVLVALMLTTKTGTSNADVVAFENSKLVTVKDNAVLWVTSLTNKKDDTVSSELGYITELIVKDKGEIQVDNIDKQGVKKITLSGIKKAEWGADSSSLVEVKSGTNLRSSEEDMAKATIRITNKTYSTAITEVKNEAQGITIKWNKKEDATGYFIYRKATGESDFTLLKEIKDNAIVTYTDTNVKEGVEYAYVVTTYVHSDKLGVNTESVKSAEKTLPRVKSCTITAAKNETNGIQVTFTKNAAATKYMLLRKTVGNGWTTGWTWIKNTTSLTCTDTTVESGKTYIYCVIPCKDKDAYQGYKSKDFQVKCVATPKVTVAKVSNGIKASWGKIAGATKYQVFRKTIGNGWESGWTWLKNTTSLSYTDTTAKAGVTYCYAVKAFSDTTQSGVGKSANIKR